MSVIKYRLDATDLGFILDVYTGALVLTKFADPNETSDHMTVLYEVVSRDPEHAYHYSEDDWSEIIARQQLCADIFEMRKTRPYPIDDDKKRTLAELIGSAPIKLDTSAVISEWKYDETLSRKHQANPHADIPLIERLKRNGSVDLRNNFREVDHGNGYSTLEPIDPTKTFADLDSDKVYEADKAEKDRIMLDEDACQRIIDADSVKIEPSGIERCDSPERAKEILERWMSKRAAEKPFTSARNILDEETKERIRKKHEKYADEYGFVNYRKLYGPGGVFDDDN